MANFEETEGMAKGTSELVLPFRAEEDRKEFYEKLKESKTVFMSIDPGYDAFKICVNGEFLMIKNSLALHPQLERATDVIYSSETTTVNLLAKDGSYQRFTLGDDVTSILSRGNVTEENQKIIEIAGAKVERFGTESFRAAMIMAIVTALHLYAKSRNSVLFSTKDVTMTDWKLALAVALPTEYKTEAQSLVERIFAEPVTADIMIGSANYHFSKWKMDEGRRVVYEAQVLAAHDNRLYYGNGYPMLEQLDQVIEEMPTLVLDFGRKTFGAAVVYENMDVSFGNDVENDDPNRFAMLAFEQETADKINEQYGEKRLGKKVLAASIGMYANGEKDLRAYRTENPRSGTEVVPVYTIRRKIIKSHIQELVNYLDSKFDIQEIHSILVCGGTGSILEEFIREAYNPMDFKDLVVTSIDASGAGMVFAVATGLYLNLVNDHKKNRG